MTYPSVEYDRAPRRVVGVLTTRPSPFGGSQCYVGAVQVDPETVKPAGDDQP